MIYRDNGSLVTEISKCKLPHVVKFWRNNQKEPFFLFKTAVVFLAFFRMSCQLINAVMQNKTNQMQVSL